MLILAVTSCTPSKGINASTGNAETLTDALYASPLLFQRPSIPILPPFAAAVSRPLTTPARICTRPFTLMGGTRRVLAAAGSRIAFLKEFTSKILPSIATSPPKRSGFIKFSTYPSAPMLMQRLRSSANVAISKCPVVPPASTCTRISSACGIAAKYGLNAGNMAPISGGAN